MENVTIIKKIGYGMSANVYLCELEKTQYAIKIEKLPEKFTEFDLSIQEWREIDFSYKFANKYPDQFVTLHNYSIEKLTSEEPDNFVVKKYTIKDNYCTSTKNRFTSKNSSDVYIKKMYTLVDDVLKNVLDDLSIKQLYSVTIQVIFICLLMKTHGYSHNDLHAKNIGIIWTNSEYVTILDKKIKTHGVHVKALDFGMILNKNYSLNKTETDICEYGLINDVNRFVNRLVTFENVKYSKINKILGWSDCVEDFNRFLKSSDYWLVESKGINPYDRFYIYQMLYPDNFQKLILKCEYKKTNFPKFRYDLKHILYIFEHKLDLKKLIKYFYKLLEESEELKQSTEPETSVK